MRQGGAGRVRAVRPLSSPRDTLRAYHHQHHYTLTPQHTGQHFLHEHIFFFAQLTNYLQPCFLPCIYPTLCATANYLYIDDSILACVPTARPARESTPHPIYTNYKGTTQAHTPYHFINLIPQRHVPPHLATAMYTHQYNTPTPQQHSARRHTPHAAGLT